MSNVKKEFNDRFHKFCEETMQHDTSFVSIRCIVTRKEGTMPQGWDVGAGCYYSFIGKIREIMIMDDENTRIESNKRSDSPSEESFNI
jgi:hypothetical protein